MTSPTQLFSNHVRPFSSFQDNVFQLPLHSKNLLRRVKSVAVIFARTWCHTLGRQAMLSSYVCKITEHQHSVLQRTLSPTPSAYSAVMPQTALAPEWKWQLSATPQLCARRELGPRVVLPQKGDDSFCGTCLLKKKKKKKLNRHCKLQPLNLF